VVNGKAAGRVSPDLVARVEQAIADLDYVVDQSASSLSSGLSRIVIMVAPDFSNPYFSKLITGVKEGLGSSFQLLLSVADRGTVPRAEDVRSLFGFRTAGMLINAPSPAFMSELPRSTTIVLLDAPGIETDLPVVSLDHETGAVALARHLADQGHRRVAYLDSVSETTTFGLRRDVFWRAAAARGIAEVRPATVRSTLDVESASQAFHDAWPQWRNEQTTAVVCATDVQAYGVLAEARVFGLGIPGQLALSGFDDLPYSKVTEPPLTTVRFPAYDLGFTAAGVLKTILRGSAPPPPDVLPGVLVVRESTARKF
jgi:DNA-binding LacI/PurR family transcriptional regulator